MYSVEEKAVCHATMGPHGGDIDVPRGPADQGDHGRPRGRRGRVYDGKGKEEKRKVARQEGKCRVAEATAAGAAAAVAACAPLRVTLEGAHWWTLAPITGAPVHLNLIQVFSTDQ